MVMSANEWDALNSMLPAEDQMSYDSYLASQGLTADDIYYGMKVGDTGKTQAQLDAYQNAIDTMNMVNANGVGTATMDPTTGYLTYTPPSEPKEEPCPTGYIKDANGNCVKQPITCPPGYILDALGNCIPINIPKTYVPPTTTVNPKPPSNNNPPPPPPPPVKTATPQYVLFNDDEVPIETIFDLTFESIGGQELLTIARNDTVNGQNVVYQPIKNLNIINEEYNPNNLIKLQNTSDTFFANFSIKLSEKTPVEGSGPNGDNVYLDNNGNLVIELINMLNDEQAEVSIMSDSTTLDDTI